MPVYCLCCDFAPKPDADAPFVHMHTIEAAGTPRPSSKPRSSIAMGRTRNRLASVYLMPKATCSGSLMRAERVELQRLLLNEAVERDAFAEELAPLAANDAGPFAEVFRVLMRNHRIRAMALRAEAGALTGSEQRPRR